MWRLSPLQPTPFPSSQLSRTVPAKRFKRSQRSENRQYPIRPSATNFRRRFSERLRVFRKSSEPHVERNETISAVCFGTSCFHGPSFARADCRRGKADAKTQISR